MRQRPAGWPSFAPMAALVADDFADHAAYAAWASWTICEQLVAANAAETTDPARRTPPTHPPTS